MGRAPLTAKPSRLDRPPAIRIAGPGDLDAIDAIERASFEVDRFPRRNLARLLKTPTAIVLLDEADGAARGYLILLFRRGAAAARLYSLAVAPAARGRGAAMNLVHAARRCVIEKGRDRLFLEVRASNAAAITLYERSGFETVRTLPRYYDDGAAALRMELRLGALESGSQ